MFIAIASEAVVWDTVTPAGLHYERVGKCTLKRTIMDVSLEFLRRAFNFLDNQGTSRGNLLT
jgi:hypothetical protein